MSQICQDAINRICLEEVMRVQGRDKSRPYKSENVSKNLLYLAAKAG